ncbi:DUF2017 family protein [Agrococcus sp. ARC_14]|uniref:DUF2017 family protein n=1 Tax=Agrococcus sp. ARC_14 TaxID=2919927 RepID=UPI001F062FE8|nr:DUF2017 family protein [Agrococcus sp. ARC_14]MCH1883556.1 DUF2017 domain-containing protein [Agrococcus sp. ARC_14]
MKAWRRDGDGAVCAMLPDEADMLANLGRQVLGLHRAVIDRRAVLDDPVMGRLYPSAYESDEEAAEFRRFASPDIAASRIQTMTRMVVDLETALPAEGDESDEAELRIAVDSEGADAWLRSLGEVRLVLHVRTGQDRAELTPDVTDEDIAQLRDVVDWLGFAQSTLLEAVA